MFSLLCCERSQPCLQHGQRTKPTNLARILTPNNTASCQAVPGFLPWSQREGMWVALRPVAIDAVVVVSPSWHRLPALPGVGNQHEPFSGVSCGPGLDAWGNDPGLGWCPALESVEVILEGIIVPTCLSHLV